MLLLLPSGLLGRGQQPQQLRAEPHSCLTGLPNPAFFSSQNISLDCACPQVIPLILTKTLHVCGVEIIPSHFMDEEMEVQRG